MKQEEVVKDFVKLLGQMVPATINAKFIKHYITKVVVDSKSLEQFIAGIDKYLKHSQTFQMGFLLHSISSVLCFSPLGSPTEQVKNMVPTDAFRISDEDIHELKELPEAKRYDTLCQKLMDYHSDESKSLEAIVVKSRQLEKLDDGQTVKNPLYNPMKTCFEGEDLTEELETKD